SLKRAPKKLATITDAVCRSDWGAFAGEVGLDYSAVIHRGDEVLVSRGGFSRTPIYISPYGRLFRDLPAPGADIDLDGFAAFLASSCQPVPTEVAHTELTIIPGWSRVRRGS